MNEDIDIPAENIFTLLMQGGLLQLLLTFLIVSIGIYHVKLSVQMLLGRRPPVAAAIHAILLFTPPCLLFLSIAAMLPTTFPELFIVGIDANEAPKHTLRLTSFLGWLCLSIFIANLVLCLVSLNHSRSSA